MRKLFRLLTVAVGLAMTEPVAAQEFDWLRTISPDRWSGPATGIPGPVASDRQGNAYVFSKMSDHFTLNNWPAIDLSHPDNIVLTALDSTGEVRWQHYFGYDDQNLLGRVTVNAATTDAAGNLYAVITFDNTNTIPDSLFLDAQPLTVPRSTEDYFLFKWHPNGTLAWVTQGGGRGWRHPEALVVDNAGSIYMSGSVTGWTGDVGNFGGTTVHISYQKTAAFCVRFRADNGAVRWVRATDQGSLSEANGGSLALDATGRLHLWVTSYQAQGDSIMWDGQLVTRDGCGSLVSLDTATGHVQRVLVGRRLGANAAFRSWYPSLTTDAVGNLYLAGVYSDSTRLGSIVFPRPQPPLLGSIGTACISAVGSTVWARPLCALTDRAGVAGGTSLNRGNSVGIAVMASGLYLSGIYSFGLLSVGGAVPPFHGGPHNTGLIVRLDPGTGVTQWADTIGGNGVNVSSSSLALASNGTGVIIGTTSADQLQAGQLTQSRVGPSGNTYTFIAHFTANYNRVDGRVYADLNGDGSYSVGTDWPQNAILTVTPATTTAFLSADAAQNGLYKGVFPAGSYSLGLAAVPPYYTLAPPTRTVMFSGGGQVQPHEDFVLTPIPGQQDLSISLTLVGRARPGFPVKYRVTYRNVGTVTLASGNVTLAHDSRLTYLSNTGGGTYSGTTLTTAYTTLAPTQERSFDVLFQLGTSAPLGSTLSSTAAIDPTTGDLTPVNNTETTNTPITGALDPNNITVNWPVLTPQQITAGEWLEYIVRFQNLGTDTAFSVLLRDSLPDDQLNLATLSLVAASHSCTWTLRPGGLLVVQFNNIHLPYAAINTVGSLGFVRFRVRPRPTLISGDLIPNRAHIQFDFTAPLTTNTATTQVNALTGLADGTIDVLPGAAWPNPTHGTLHVEATVATPGPLTLRLLDALGRLVLEQVVRTPAGTARQTFDLRELPAGLYLLRAEAGGLGFTRRVVVP